MKLENYAGPSNEAGTEIEFTPQEGGAITSFKSTVTFTGVSSLSNNQAYITVEQYWLQWRMQDIFKGGSVVVSRAKIKSHAHLGLNHAHF